MALNLFPTTRTIAWYPNKTPNWGTRMQRAISGRELRVQDYVLPIYTITLEWEVLIDRWDQRAGPATGRAFFPNTTPLDELRQVWTFFNQQMGGTIPFAYNDLTDNTTRALAITPQVFNFAVGDGVTPTFQMASPLLAPVVPNVITTVNLGGTPTGAYTVNTNTGLITFTSPPGAGVAIGADFTFYYKVRFATDNAEAEYFAYQFWRMKQLKLISVFGDPIAIGVAQIIFSPPDPDIPDTTPVGTVVATFTVFRTDGVVYTGTPAFAAPNFDDSGHFGISGPVSGPGPYNLTLLSSLPSPTSIEAVTIVP